MLDEKIKSKYATYKPCSIDGVYEIPKTWEEVALDTISKIKSEINHQDKELLSVYLRRGVIRFSDVTEKRTNVTSLDLSNYQHVEKGDFVLNNQQAWRGSVGVSDYEGIVSPAYLVLRLSEKLDRRYANFLFRESVMVGQYLTSSKGVGTIQRNLYWPQLKRKRILSPPKLEQVAIANFLDDKTEKIDRAIAIKEAQIARLEERKQILIQTAVTRGLDPNVPMKDSGVDWIGEIPAHWEAEKLFGLSRFVRGNSAFAKDDLLSNGKYVAVQYGKTYKVDEINDTYEFYVNEEFYKETQKVNFGDVILISTSETIEDLGHSAIYSRSEVGLIGGEQLLIKPNIDFLDHYYLYYSTKVFSRTLRKYATGIKVFRFNINDLKSIYMAVPPKEEQRKIVRYLSAQSMKIGQTKSLLETQIDHLREYRASLINAAVTGKIKVTS